jgi:hypothetical protein
MRARRTYPLRRIKGWIKRQEQTCAFSRGLPLRETPINSVHREALKGHGFSHVVRTRFASGFSR